MSELPYNTWRAAAKTKDQWTFRASAMRVRRVPPSDGIRKIADKEIVMDKLVELGAVSEETQGTFDFFSEFGQIPCAPFAEPCD